jgi:hypothetical protein
MRIVRGIVIIIGLALGIAGPLGCTSGRSPKLPTVAWGGTVQAILQKDAPVQIVSITPTEDNLLASVVVKNATDRYVQDFDITWTIFRPVNCAISGSAPRIQQASTEGHQIYAENPGPPLPRGRSWVIEFSNPTSKSRCKPI